MTTEEQKRSNRERQNKYRKNHRELVLKRSREYQQLRRKQNPEQAKEHNKIFGKKYRDSHKEDEKKRLESYRLLRKYGLSVEERDKILESQNYKCAICGKLSTPNKKLHVDHNHKTNQVRELLCFSCNSIIGLSHENIETLQSIINYLNKHKQEK